MVTVLRVQL